MAVHVTVGILAAGIAVVVGVGVAGAVGSARHPGTDGPAVVNAAVATGSPTSTGAPTAQSALPLAGSSSTPAAARPANPKAVQVPNDTIDSATPSATPSASPTAPQRPGIAIPASDGWYTNPSGPGEHPILYCDADGNNCKDGDGNPWSKDAQGQWVRTG